jgi:hypothetical protein
VSSVWFSLFIEVQSDQKGLLKKQIRELDWKIVDL